MYSIMGEKMSSILQKHLRDKFIYEPKTYLAFT